MMSCWGWATWRRAWQYYDIAIRLWPKLRNRRWLSDILGDDRAAAHWQHIFDLTYGNHQQVDYWDYQWAFACWAQNGLTVLPNTNLVHNIGFGEHATHTKSANHSCAQLKQGEIRFPLRYPPNVIRDKACDQRLFDKFIPQKSGQLTWFHRRLKKLKHALRSRADNIARIPFSTMRKNS
jgi:hypothetical protein